MIMSECAGLRPGRPQVRLERDRITDKYGNTLEVRIRKDALKLYNYKYIMLAGSITHSGECERQQALLVLSI
jgi:hypothetical protein